MEKNLGLKELLSIKLVMIMIDLKYLQRFEQNLFVRVNIMIIFRLMEQTSVFLIE